MEKETIKALAETTARATAAALAGNVLVKFNRELEMYSGQKNHLNVAYSIDKAYNLATRNKVWTYRLGDIPIDKEFRTYDEAEAGARAHINRMATQRGGETLAKGDFKNLIRQTT